MTHFNTISCQQYLVLQVDAERAMRDLPLLLQQEPEARAAALGIARQVAGATVTLAGDGAVRLERVAEMFAPRAPKLAVVSGKNEKA